MQCRVTLSTLRIDIGARRNQGSDRRLLIESRRVEQSSGEGTDKAHLKRAENEPTQQPH
jgi:hypothetical protein